MPDFLVDENLPLLNPLWTGDDYIHQKDIPGCESDKEIWEYAKLHQLTIISKDSDFSNRIQFHEPPPKVIHIRLATCVAKKWEESFSCYGLKYWR